MDERQRRAQRLRYASDIGKKALNKEIPTVKLNRVFDEEKGKAVLKPELSDKTIKLPEKSESVERLKQKAKAELRAKIDRELAENEDDNLGTEAFRKGGNASLEARNAIKKSLPDDKLIRQKTVEALKKQKKKLEREKRWKEFKKETFDKTKKETTKKAAKKTAETGAKKAVKETGKEAVKAEARHEFHRFLFKKAQRTAAKEAAKKTAEAAAVKVSADATVAVATTETTKHAVGIATGVEEVLLIISAVIIMIIMLIILIAVILTFIFFHGFFQTNIAMGMYQAEETEIEQAELHMSYLEACLVDYMYNLPSNEEGYDGYVIEGGITVGHNPFTLINYLTCRYGDFTYSSVEGEINDLFNEMYTIDKWIEEKQVPKEDDDEDDDDEDEDDDDEDDEIEYETIYILHVKLTRDNTLDEVVSTRLSDEEKEQYELLDDTKGGLQFIASPIGGNYYGNMSSYYGYRYHPISHNISLHRGLDIALPENTPLIAGISGEVTYTGYDEGGYGNYIIIKNERNEEVRYAHMNEVSLNTGDMVTKGETVLGLSGNTGASTGPHVHIEVLKEGDYRNPLFYIADS